MARAAGRAYAYSSIATDQPTLARRPLLPERGREPAMLVRVAELEMLNDDGRDVLESLPGFIMTIDKEHRITWCSRYANGLTPELVIGKPAVEFVAPEYRETARRIFEECFRTGEPTSYETSSGGRI